MTDATRQTVVVVGGGNAALCAALAAAEGGADVTVLERAPNSAGELVGGLFYFNYPGGSGLTNGSVFGRIAGTGAAKVTR